MQSVRIKLQPQDSVTQCLDSGFEIAGKRMCNCCTFWDAIG